MNNKQQGAVLVLTLVILVMLSFYGVVSTRDAKSQMQIVGNSQLYSQALASAEGTLTKAENTINCLLETCKNNTGGDADGNSICPQNDRITDQSKAFLNLGGPFLGDGKLSINKSTALTNANCIGGDYLSANDLTGSDISVSLIDSIHSHCGEGRIQDADGAGISNQRTRVEIFEISVQSNELKRGQRRVKSNYIVFSEEYCS